MSCSHQYRIEFEGGPEDGRVEMSDRCPERIELKTPDLPSDLAEPAKDLDPEVRDELGIYFELVEYVRFQPLDGKVGWVYRPLEQVNKNKSTPTTVSDVLNEIDNQ